MFNQKRVREPAVAGTFYPADPEQLTDQLKSLFQSVPLSDQKSTDLIGAIVPHAGYPYSGPVAAYAYRAIQQLTPGDIILVGPSHREYFKGCSVYNGSGVKTPLGELAVNSDLVEKICDAHGGIFPGEKGHSSEHTLEVQLPFLQYIYEHDFRITMITLGDQSTATVTALADTLSEVWSAGMLVLASSDLSHYYDYDKAVAMDHRLGNLVEQYDIRGLWKALDRHEIEACGFGAVMTLLELGKQLGKAHTRVYRYMNSGDVTGERNRVVGYLAAGVESVNTP